MDDNKKTYISHDLIYDELIRRGYHAQNIQLGEKFTLFSATNGKTWLTRNATLSYPCFSGSPRQICKDKKLSQIFALSLGVSVPLTLEYSTNNIEAIKFMEAFAPLVVKPLDSFGSRGVTMNVVDEKSLNMAIATAKTYSEVVLLQQQFLGQEIRFTVIDGVVEAAIYRQNPRIVGDGVASIAELIRRENVNRKDLNLPYISYPQLSSVNIPEYLMSAQGVLGLDEILVLSNSTLVRTGASMYNVTDEVHDDYKATAVKLAMMLSPKFMAVDLIIKDYTKPQTQDNYVFLEFTTSPALPNFSGMRGGEQYDMVSRVADMIDDYCEVLRFQPAV